MIGDIKEVEAQLHSLAYLLYIPLGEHSRTPLMTAAVANQVDVVHVLMKHDRQAVQRVAERGATEGVKIGEAAYIPLAQGINAVDEDNATALRLASERGHVGMVRLLLEHGALPRVERNHFAVYCLESTDALQGACIKGQEEVVGLLLAREGEEMTLDRLNLLIRRSCEAGQGAVVVMLATTSVGSCKWKWRQLREAMESAGRLGRVDLLHQLLPLTAQEDANTTVELLSYALWEAVKAGHPEAASLLLHHGADTWLTSGYHQAEHILQRMQNLGEPTPQQLTCIHLISVSNMRPWVIGIPKTLSLPCNRETAIDRYRARLRLSIFRLSLPCYRGLSRGELGWWTRRGGATWQP
jgi:ankyrin repeat protein